MSFVVSAAAFLVAVGILVSFHEFGHFWVAKRLGVKVLRFSIGFGRPLWRRVAGEDQTEYVIAAIPLGGYVKMLDERESEVSPAELGRAFNRQSLAKRFAIVAAGPAFNFILAIAAYWLMFMLGVSGLKPILGEITPDSLAAKAGLQAQDEVLRVADRETPTWQIASLELIDQALKQGQVPLSVLRDGAEVAIDLDLSDTRHLLAEGNLLDKLGVKPWRGPDEPVLGELIEGAAAEQAGLRPGDRILAMDGEPVERWTQWADYVRARPGVAIALTIQRGEGEITIEIVPQEAREGDKTIGRVGAYSKAMENSAEFYATVRYNPLAGLAKAMAETVRITALTLKVLGKLIVGEASVRNISGPITIAEFAGTSALIGLSAFLGVLALFSISIGVLNLLPIPVLDGGHLLFYLVEWIKGSPVSESAEAAGQRIGLVMLAGLITLALYNDIIRLIG